MKFKDKKLFVLKELYTRRFDGNIYDLEKLNEDFDINRDEAHQIAKSLSDSGHIRIWTTKDGINGKIEPFGIEFIEEEKFIESSYSPTDPFTSDEKIEIIKRLDELAQRLSKIEKGQEIIYDDLFKQMVELQELINVLGKKDWLQILKGKLIDAGFGKITSEVSEIIIDIFKTQNFLDGY